MRSTKLMALVLTGGFIAFWLSPASVMAASTTVLWKDIIGIIQAGNLVGSGTGQLTGGGEPWSAKQGFAQVNLTTGKVKFLVQGLVFAGGNPIGTPDGVEEVVGTLVCDTDGSAGTGGGANSVLVDTDVVPLSAQGNAQFVGNVVLPAVCQAESDIAFLIRAARAGVPSVWIANGSVRKP